MVVTIASLVGSVAVLWCAVWGIHRWATYPTVPDVKTTDLESAINFMGSEDFNRMLQRHRLAYALAVVDRLGQASFAEILRIMINRGENRPRVARNLAALEGREQISAKMFAIFLEKYYALSPTERQVAMVSIIAVQQGIISKDPKEFGLPTMDELRHDMSRMMSRQSPRVQAMCGQFLIDMKRQRDKLGLKDPF
jgi:hypothetical protein